MFKNCVNKIKELPSKEKNTVLMVLFAAFICLVLLPFAFFGNPGLALGFLFGTLIEIICYRLLCITSDIIAKSVNGTAKNSLIILSTFGFFIRFILYAGGLVLAAFDTFKWKLNILNIWTTFAAYLPMAIIIAITTLKSNKGLDK